MKRVLFSIGALAFMSSQALSADIYGGSTKDDPGYTDTPRINWSGVYIGPRLGFGKDSHDLNVTKYKDEPASCGEGGVVNEAGDGCVPSELIPGEEAVEAQEAVEAKEATEASCQGVGQFENFEYKVKEDGCYFGQGNKTKSETAIFTPAQDAVEGKEAVEAKEATAPSCSNGGALVEGECVSATFIDATTIAKSLFSETLDDSGVFYGGIIGADVQRGRGVFGVFAYYDVGDTETDARFGYSLEHNGEWAIGARAGYLVNERLLAYISAAYKQVDIEVNGPALPGLDTKPTFDGIEGGLGLEYMVANNTSIGVEATHFWGSEETLFSNCPAAVCVEATDELSQFKVMGTVRIKLNSGLFN